MLSNICIQRVVNLPMDIHQELSIASSREGFPSINWLIDEWTNGKNTFSLPGESFYEARVNGRLVGVCGLNLDPYGTDLSLGRLRRLYVLPELRRKGVGRLLVSRVLKDAHGHFKVVRLMTLDNHSALFFEALGFSKVIGEERVSHTIQLNPLG